MIGITGASGHMGTTLRRMLDEKNTPYVGFYRKGEDNDKSFVGDLDNFDHLLDFTKGKKTVIHIAAIVWPCNGKNREVQYVNVDLTKKLYEACRENGVEHFIFISSIHAMVTHDVPVINEESPLFDSPKVAYDYSKAQAEKYLSKQEGMKLTILNPTAVIGPYDPYFSGMNKMFRLLQNGKLPVTIPGGFNIVDVRDVSEVIIKAAVNGIEGKYIVGNKYEDVSDLISSYADIAEVKKPFFKFGRKAITFVSYLCEFFQPFVKRPIETNRYAIEALLKTTKNIQTDKVRSTFDWRPIPVEKTIKDIQKWITGQHI